MSYASQALLMGDGGFQGRVTSVSVQQAEVFRDDQRPDFVALAAAVAKGVADVTLTFTRLAAAGPGIADKVDNGDGTIDQAKVTDADLLSLTQANWPYVAALYFTSDGTPI